MLSGDGCYTLMTSAALFNQTMVPREGEETKQGGLSNGQSSKVQLSGTFTGTGTVSCLLLTKYWLTSIHEPDYMSAKTTRAAPTQTISALKEYDVYSIKTHNTNGHSVTTRKTSEATQVASRLATCSSRIIKRQDRLCSKLQRYGTTFPFSCLPWDLETRSLAWQGRTA